MVTAQRKYLSKKKDEWEKGNVVIKLQYTSLKKPIFIYGYRFKKDNIQNHYSIVMKNVDVSIPENELNFGLAMAVAMSLTRK